MNAVDLVFFWVAMLECLIATFYAAKFVIQYRRVKWRGSAWGEHIMIFSVLGGLLFALTFIGNIVALLEITLPHPWHLVARYVWYVITVILFGAAAYGYRQRGLLERETNRLREERKQKRQE